MIRQEHEEVVVVAYKLTHDEIVELWERYGTGEIASMLARMTS